MSKLEQLFLEEIEELKLELEEHKKLQEEAEARIKSDEQIISESKGHQAQLTERVTSVQKKLDAYREDMAEMRKAAQMYVDSLEGEAKANAVRFLETVQLATATEEEDEEEPENTIKFSSA